MRKWMALSLAVLTLAASLPAFAAEEGNFTLAAGTRLEVRLMTTLTSRATQEGDPWSGRIVEPVFSGGEEVLPSGSILEGRVTYVKEAGRVKGRGEMRLLAETITTPQDVKYKIVASLEEAQGAAGAAIKDKEGTIQGPSKSKKDAAKEAGIGAGVGAGVGVLAAGGTGALYGAGIGLLASAIHSIAKRGKDLVLPVGTEFTFTLDRDTTAQRAAKPVEATPKEAAGREP
jgi:hypothetical protein